MTHSYSPLYPPDYFRDRLSNDPKRQKAYLSEKEFIHKYVSSGKLLDVGCSTGEFVTALNWQGDVYGVEISEYAKEYARKVGIRFDKDLFNSTNYFDLIIMRGVIQHIDTPFLYIKKAYESLQKGGYLVFLATPNANSVYYKLWNTLPFLDPPRNFYIPSDKGLIQALKNFGFKLIEIRYPYWASPYKSLMNDHLKFLLKLLGFNCKFPFWRNSMDLIAQKI
jgi:SAM-dependent methyltransferase